MRGVLEGEAAQPQSLSWDCGGTAPVTVQCARGFHAGPGAAYELTVDAGTGFTGTVTARLLDAQGNWRSLTCTYLAFVGGVTPPPACAPGGNGPLVAGELTLVGLATDPASENPSVGYWEVQVRIG